jgi:type III restriction enzyme
MSNLITTTQGICGGNARIRNTRIPVWTLVSLHNLGASDQRFIRQLPWIN